ncbi:hypothetical protein FRB95_014901 [Tulasnella sp. JGI-2019a]|nr:hypothetical protein FRB95_014901 [Tulasnella sp. JGI-2019a]
MFRKSALSSGSTAYLSSTDIALLAITLASLLFLSLYLFGSPVYQLRTASHLRAYLSSKRYGKSLTPFYSTAAAYSQQRALNTFAHYGVLSRSTNATNWFSLSKLNQRHRALSEAIGYDAKLKRLEWAEQKNAFVAQEIAHFAEDEYEMKPGGSTESDFYRATEAMKHLVRDWSDEGRVEREHTHGPILEALKTCCAVGDRPGMKVLVPGCGMGRLAWEIYQLGKHYSQRRSPT